MKSNMKLSIIVCSVLFAIVGVLSAYMINPSAEAEAVEEVVKSKELAYRGYAESIEGVLDGEDIDDKLKVFDVSVETLSEVFNDVEMIEYHEKTIEGNEHLERLKQEAEKNLNDSLYYMLTNDVENNDYEIFKEARKLTDALFFTTDENADLLRSIDREYLSQYVAKHGKPYIEVDAMDMLQTGLSEKEIRVLLGSPNNRFKTSEAEFWSYDEVVLTMKNGFVYEVTYSN